MSDIDTITPYNIKKTSDEYKKMSIRGSLVDKVRKWGTKKKEETLNPNKPRFSRCDVYSGKPLIDIFTLPYVAYLGDGASLKVVLYEANTVIICNFVWIPNCLVNPELQDLYMIFQ